MIKATPQFHALLVGWAAAVFLVLVQRHPLTSSIWSWRGSRDVKSEQYEQIQVSGLFKICLQILLCSVQVWVVESVL